MTAVPVRLSVIALDLVAAFADEPLPPEAVPLLAELDRSGLVVHGYRVVHTAAGRVVQLPMAPGRSPQARLSIPGFTAAELVLDLGDDAVLEVVEPGPFTPYAEVRGIRLAVRFDPALLRPVDGVDRAALSWTGSLRWYRDGRLELGDDPELALSPCEIGRTGIVVELAGVQLDLATGRSPAAVRDLGLDAAFQGVVARSGTVRLLPQARFGGLEGIRVDIRDLAVGTSGVTGTIGRFYTLEPTADGLLDPTVALVGELGGWQVGIGSVELRLRESAVTGFRIAGMVRIPVLDALVDVVFGLMAAGTGYTTTIRVGSRVPVVVDLGLGNSLSVAGFELAGALVDSGAFAVSGAVEGIELALPPLALSAGSVAVAIEHGGAGDELRVALRDVPLGPLGTLDAATLLVREGRSVTIEATLTWDDLRSRLDLPAGFPVPGSGTVAALLSWDEDGGARRITVRLSAELGDLGDLLGFLPVELRPRIETAALDVEIGYPTAAAFGAASATGPLGGAVSLAVTMALPMLLDVPGVVAVRTGDAGGFVRASLTARGNGVAFAIYDSVEVDLTLPGAPAGSPVAGLRLTSLGGSAGPAAGESTIVLAGAASVPPVDAYLAATVTRYGLPDAVSELVGPAAGALPDEGTFALTVHSDGTTVTPSIELTARASDPPAFALLERIGQVVDAAGTPPSDATALPATTLPGLGAPQDFFAVRPDAITLSATMADPPSLRFGASLLATVFGETFDMTFSVTIEQDGFRIAAGAGTSDPILITAPVPDPAALLGEADVAAIAAAYGLGTAGRQQLEDLERFLADLAAELGPQGVLAFEISDLEIAVTALGPSASGAVRLVQLPRFLEQLTPITDLELSLGADVDKIFVQIVRRGGDASGPLLRVPVPGDGDVVLDVYFRNFLLAYAWGQNAFAFALDAGVVPSESLDLTAGGSGVHLPAVRADVQLGATATAPPAPIPQGVLTFRRPTRLATDRAVDELGLQAVVGDGRGRLVTVYLRELAFSPTYFLLWPGFKADAGLVLGGPDPADVATAVEYLAVRDWNRDAFFARFTVRQGTLIFFDPMLGLLVNPLAVLPPFLTLNPPYWISPPLIMGDLYAEEVGVSVNLPGLAFFDLTFQRPLPTFSLQALLELAALAAGGFTRPIPTGSPLRRMFFARLSVALEFRVPGLSATSTRTNPPAFEVNAADLANGALEVLQKASAALDDAATLVDRIADDPGALVRMIPSNRRRIDHDLSIGGFAFSGSLHLLAPEELQEELVLYFDSKRKRHRGGAALPGPPPPTSAPPVLEVPEWSLTTPVTWKGILDPRSLVPDVEKVGGRVLDRSAAARAARDAAVDRLRLDRRRRIDESAASVAGALVADRGNARARTTLLRGLGLDDLRADVDSKIARARGNAPAEVRPLTQQLRKLVSGALSSKERAMVADSDLAAPPEEIAARMIARLVEPAVPSRPGRPTLRPAADRKREIELLVPGARVTGTRQKIGDALTSLDQRLRAPATSDAAARQAIDETTTTIQATLATQFRVRRGTLDVVLDALPDTAVLRASIVDRARATWRLNPQLVARRADVRVFDGAHFADQLRGLDRFRRPIPHPDDTVRTVATYEIRVRDGDPHAGSFGVPVGSASALYTVVLDGSVHRLKLRGRDRTWTLHDLPRALRDSVPDGPLKADLLRGRLVVAPRIVTRARTAAETDAVADTFEQSAVLYQTSVFARPEYAVKHRGGVRGPFTLADLLRDPASGAYTVPAGPALIGGFSATLFDSDVRMAGIVVADRNRPSAFLFGHHTLVAEVGRYEVRATGDFVASAGDLWQILPLPSGTVAARDAIAFSGHIVVDHDGDTVFEGSAEGRFTIDDGDLAADLTVAVRSEGSIDLGIADTEFARIAWLLAADLHLEMTPQQVSVEASAVASVTVEVATYAVKWVIDVPERTVCTDVPVITIVPPGLHMESICIRTPEISHPEIDFEHPDWESLGSADCGLHVSSSPAGVDIRLDLTALDGSVAGRLGQTELYLPGLV